jgi:hypothetical protein
MGTKGKMFLGVMVMTLALMPLASISQAGMKGHEGAAEMKMHHIHIVMNHGLGMVTEGSSLIMLGEMNMASGIDALTLDHGKQMIKNGKGVVQRALSGDEMMGMHKEGQGPDKNPAMKDTHDLGEAILKYTGLVEGMKMGSMSGDAMMEMHHQHIMINHALEMAAEGSNLVMLGDMKMAGTVDDYTVEHGKMMIKNAKTLLGEITSGKGMTDMHKKGHSPNDDPMMKNTHDLIESALKIIDLYEKM